MGKVATNRGRLVARAGETGKLALEPLEDTDVMKGIQPPPEAEKELRPIAAAKG